MVPRIASEIRTSLRVKAERRDNIPLDCRTRNLSALRNLDIAIITGKQLVCLLPGAATMRLALGTGMASAPVLLKAGYDPDAFQAEGAA
jgi:hypothetical protein